jgi:regulatory protein
MRQWGRKKIQYELQQKRINSFVIKIALKEIDQHKYVETLQKLALAKWNALKNEKYLVRQSKITSYLLQKGYEQSLIRAVINRIKEPGKD